MTRIIDVLVITVIVVVDAGIHIELDLKDALIRFGLKHHFDEFIRRGWVTIEDLLQERGA